MGDGTFSLYKNKKGNWNFSFQFAQSVYNAKLVHLIKKNIGVGSILYEESTKMLYYKVRKIESIITEIIPIFDKYMLITKKKNDYLLFRSIIFIWIDNNISKDPPNFVGGNKKKEEKNKRIDTPPPSEGVKRYFNIRK